MAQTRATQRQQRQPTQLRLKDPVASTLPPSLCLRMGPHMDERTRALCYFYRHPPPAAGVKAMTYARIASVVPAKPRLNKDQVRWAVKHFHLKPKQRGRPLGFRKTTAFEDKTILATFFKVRQPLGSSVESRDVWNALPQALRKKVSLRTVRNRLREKGYAMDEKLTGDDKGLAWRQTRVRFCKRRSHWSEAMWKSHVQAVGDFRFFTYFPMRMKRQKEVKGCPRTIMSKAEKTKPAFLKPKHHIFKRSEYKHALKAKVFGLTTSNGLSLIVPCTLHPASPEWVKILRNRVAPFLAEAFPHRRSYTLLLDGETILHTQEAKDAMADCGVRLLSPWPPHSPDLNPQEHVWGWAERQLRKEELRTDSFSVFKRRIIQTSRNYVSKEKLVPSLAGRLQRCLKRGGAPIGK